MQDQALTLSRPTSAVVFVRVARASHSTVRQVASSLVTTSLAAAGYALAWMVCSLFEGEQRTPAVLPAPRRPRKVTVPVPASLPHA